MNVQLGIDIGGTGIKGGLVDLDKGQLVSERIKYKTPPHGGPKKILKYVGLIAEQCKWDKKHRIGIGFPAIVRDGVCHTANHIDSSWVDKDINGLIRHYTGYQSLTINDADAASIGELNYGGNITGQGTEIFLTLGTGIGSGVFLDGRLLMNTELGSLIYNKGIAEHYASNRTRKIQKLNWSQYGQVLNDFLMHLYRIFSPNHIIIGGGISKKFNKFSREFDAQLSVLPARLMNNAGIIGAAHFCKFKNQNR